MLTTEFTAAHAHASYANESNVAHEAHANDASVHRVGDNPAHATAVTADHRMSTVIALYFAPDHSGWALADVPDERDHGDHKLIVLLLSPRRLYCNLIRFPRIRLLTFVDRRRPHLADRANSSRSG